MRTIAALFLSLAACGGAAVCSGCADDAGGWSRDELPANGNIQVTMTAVNGSACDIYVNQLEVQGMGVADLNTESPSIYQSLPTGAWPCSWDGSTMTCASPVAGSSRSFAADFAGMWATLTDGDSACSVDFMIDEVRAITPT